MKKAIAIFGVFTLMLISLCSMATASTGDSSTPERGTIVEKGKKSYINKGVFSDELMDKIGNFMKEYKKRNPQATEDKMIKDLAAEIVNKQQKNVAFQASYYDDFYHLITKNLGPTEQQVYNSNPTYGNYVLLDAKLALDSAESKYTDLHNGKGDAYRHGLWQGLSAFHTTKDYAKAFGDAHENDFPGPQIETIMDLWNNSIGRDIGATKWAIWQVYSGVDDGMRIGSFRYIKNGNLVPTNQ